METELIDAIRAELQRQARHKRFDLEAAERPDDVRVYGILDLHELAKAIGPLIDEGE